MWMQKSEVFDVLFAKKQLSFLKKLNIYPSIKLFLNSEGVYPVCFLNTLLK